MNEDDTFKKLKGLTFAQALELYDSLYEEHIYELKNHSKVVEIIDKVLNEYNWSVEKLGKEYYERNYQHD